MCLKQLLIIHVSSVYLKAITPEEIQAAFMHYQHSLPMSYLMKTKVRFVIYTYIYFFIFYCVMLFVSKCMYSFLQICKSYSICLKMQGHRKRLVKFKNHNSKSNWGDTIIFFAKYMAVIQDFLDVSVSQLSGNTQ